MLHAVSKSSNDGLVLPFLAGGTACPVHRYQTRSFDRAPGRSMRPITPCRTPYRAASYASLEFITPAATTRARLAGCG